MSVRSPLHVRSVTIDDAESIAEMGRESLDYFDGLGDPDPHSLTAEEFIRDAFGDDPVLGGFVAERAGQPLGYALYANGYDLDRGGRYLYLVDLFVRASARGTGAGRALMEHVASVGRERGCRQLFWSVYVPNTTARAFYDHLGARATHDLGYMYLVLD